MDWIGSKMGVWPVQPGRGLSPGLRMNVYAIVGVSLDVAATATWDFNIMYDRRLHGFSSLWTAMLYGVSFLGVDLLYQRFSTRVHLAVRGLLYTVWLSFIQLTFGCLLDAFNARPWNYSMLSYSIFGSIALELIPLVYIVSVLAELFLVRSLLILTWSDVINVGWTTGAS